MSAGRHSEAAFETVIEAHLLTIALLKERRATLIAAAVTGQIDVRSAEYYTDDAANHTELPRRQ